MTKESDIQEINYGSPDWESGYKQGKANGYKEGYKLGRQVHLFNLKDYEVIEELYRRGLTMEIMKREGREGG
ncbi:MAG: hypothetical protein ACYSSI_12970 [Planctomycetota bacterium]|jgi:hypothetical protein